MLCGVKEIVARVSVIAFLFASGLNASFASQSMSAQELDQLAREIASKPLMIDESTQRHIDEVLKNNATLNAEREQYQKKMSIQNAPKTSFFESATNSDAQAHLFVFISFSMPEQSLKNYLQAANKVGARVVVRGLINNDFTQTITRIQELVEEDNQSGVIVDPTLFAQFQIQRVPAVVVSEGAYPCQEKECQFHTFDVLYGNVDLAYALEHIRAQGDLGEQAHVFYSRLIG